MTDTELRDLLSDQEELYLEFRGKSDNLGFGRSTIGITDQRLVWVARNGTFGDLDYSHIISMDSKRSLGWKEADNPKIGLFKGAIGAMLFLPVGIILGLSGLSWGWGLFGIALTAFIGFLVIFAIQNSGIVQILEIKTGDPEYPTINIHTTAEEAANLVRVIRNHT